MIEMVCYSNNNTDLCLATQLIGLFTRGMGSDFLGPSDFFLICL